MAFGATVRVHDRGQGARAAIAELGDTAGMVAKVGLFEGIHAPEADGEDDLTIAEYGAIHEFGAPPRIPQRSFIRSTMEEQAGKYGEMLDRVVAQVAGQVVGVGESMRRGLARVGREAMNDIKRKITTLRDPPNAESTVERKGSSNPLIDTGAMRNAVTFEVVHRRDQT